MNENNDNVENLNAADAISKLQELVKNANICMFTTRLQHLPLNSRPMSTQKVDDDGNMWFLSPKDSAKNAEIEADNHIHLFYINNGNSEYLSVAGTAEILYDRQKIEELWNPIAKAWFTEGKDDPRISIIKVQPEQSYYWDTKHGKMVSLVKIAAAIISGKTMDDGVEGVLEVS